MILDELKYDTFISIYMKLSALSSNKPYSYYDQTLVNLIKLSLIKSRGKYSRASQFARYISTVLSKAILFFIFKNVGMPLFMQHTNIYQQTRSDQHKNISNHNIITYIPFSSHQTHILNFPQQNKSMKHYQEYPESVLLKITPYPHQTHQNHMSISLHT